MNPHRRLENLRIVQILSNVSVRVQHTYHLHDLLRHLLVKYLGALSLPLYGLPFDTETSAVPVEI